MVLALNMKHFPLWRAPSQDDIVICKYFPLSLSGSENIIHYHYWDKFDKNQVCKWIALVTLIRALMSKSKGNNRYHYKVSTVLFKTSPRWHCRAEKMLKNLKKKIADNIRWRWLGGPAHLIFSSGCRQELLAVAGWSPGIKLTYF